MSKADIPLHLYQVLEEEYASLHGPIRADRKFYVQLPDEENENYTWCVEAGRDWFFRLGHVKDVEPLAGRLRTLEEASQRAASPDSPLTDAEEFLIKEDPLTDHLLSQFSDELKAELRAYRRPVLPDAPESATVCPPDEVASEASPPPVPPPSRIPAETEALLIAELNEKVLKNPKTAERRLYKYAQLNTQTDEMLELHESSTPLEGEDLVHLNRLLLENAFPHLFERIRNIRLAAMYKRLHGRRQSALCLSGGGIRSGTFALGIIQKLASLGLLEKFDYLSTVSGGGYIGSWLSAWLHRHRDGLEGVVDDLSNRGPVSKIDPDPAPIQYLRQYSNFITPKVGLLTADTWTFVGIYLRNLLLNWSVLFLIFMAALLIPRLIVAAILGQSDFPTKYRLAALGTTFGPSFFPRYLLLVVGSFLTFRALVYIGMSRPSASEILKERSPFWGRRLDQRSFIFYCLLPLVLAAFCLTTYSAWSRIAHGLDTNASIIPGVPRWVLFLIFGGGITLFSWLWYTFVVLRRGEAGKQREIRWLELWALLSAGLFGGFMFYIASVGDFGNPVARFIDASIETWDAELYACFAVPLFLLLFTLATTLYVGLSSYSPGVKDEDREWLSRLNAWLLIVVIVWSVLCALVIFGPLVLLNSPKLLASIGGISGLFSLLVGRSAVTPANDREQGRKGLAALILGNILSVLALVFFAIFVAALSLLTSLIVQQLFTVLLTLAVSDAARLRWLAALLVSYDDPYGLGWHITRQYLQEMRTASAVAAHMRAVHYPSFWFFFIAAFLLAVTGIMLSRLINLNLFSLHGGYRNRLIRGFLGASREQGERKPNPFTGFDPSDDISMHELGPALLHESDFETAKRTSAQNLILLALRIRDVKDDMSRYLKEGLRDSRAPIDRYTGDAPLSATLRRDLLEDLNRLLEERRFDDDQTLAANYIKSAKAVRARRRIAEAGERGVPGKYQVYLNRLMMEEAYKGIIKPSPFPPPPYKLFHVINTSLNLVGGDKLAWQQRKAEPFSVTPLHAGCFRVGYRRSRDYGGEGGISIGTAAAISGAAASSNMGYYTTSPLISLLLTIFNVRLGWWLGNPGVPGNRAPVFKGTFSLKERERKKIYRRSSPEFSLSPVLQEAFGLTDDRSDYVYLTDGGHFENLALYEMVLRRCRLIIVSDGAEDSEYKFTDLGNAVRKIRIDLGIPIEFTEVNIFSMPDAEMHGEKDKQPGLYWAIGRIRYTEMDHGPEARDGVLLYVKPAVYGKDEPRDVLEYKKSHPEFPHQSTGDQFFDEPQFESYRTLGSFIVEQMWRQEDKCEDEEGAREGQLSGLYELFRRAYERTKVIDPQLSDWLPRWLEEEQQAGGGRKGEAGRGGGTSSPPLSSPPLSSPPVFSPPASPPAAPISSPPDEFSSPPDEFGSPPA